MGYNQQRTAEDIKRELAMLIPTLKDPRISGMLSIVKLDLSGDGSSCKVYVSAIEGMKTSKVSARGLTAAAGFIRREIARKLRLRVIPHFEFIADDSIEYSAHIAQKLRTLGADGASQDDESEEDND